MAEERKEWRRMNKEEEKPVEYFLYDIKVQATVPCELVYKIRSTSPEQALKDYEKGHPTSFRPILARKKISRAIVYGSGSLMIKTTKNYR